MPTCGYSRPNGREYVARHETMATDGSSGRRPVGSTRTHPWSNLEDNTHPSPNQHAPKTAVPTGQNGVCVGYWLMFTFGQPPRPSTRFQKRTHPCPTYKHQSEDNTRPTHMIRQWTKPAQPTGSESGQHPPNQQDPTVDNTNPTHRI